MSVFACVRVCLLAFGGFLFGGLSCVVMFILNCVLGVVFAGTKHGHRTALL